MTPSLSRRQFSLSALAAAGGMLVGQNNVGAAPPSSSTPKVSSKPYPPLAVTPIPAAFEDRYADLGGVLDLTNRVIWGYEPYCSLVNYSTMYQGDQVHQAYLDILAMRAISGTTPEENATFANAYEIADQRTWRWPTVFEARDAVAKGLFTFGDGGLNLYYGSPLYEIPAVSYYLTTLRWTCSEVKPNSAHVWSAADVRWTRSEVKPNLVHAFSPADGGTLLVSKTSSLPAMVVSKL